MCGQILSFFRWWWWLRVCVCDVYLSVPVCAEARLWLWLSCPIILSLTRQAHWSWSSLIDWIGLLVILGLHKRHPAYYMRGSELCPHACIASILPTKPSPEACHSCLQCASTGACSMSPWLLSTAETHSKKWQTRRVHLCTGGGCNIHPVLF